MNFGDIMTRMINPIFGNTSLLALPTKERILCLDSL
jgi:hypothetical protein